MRQPQVARLADGRRLHLQDGPIDLVIEAFGATDAVAAAYAAATRRFTGLLDELVEELPLLRTQSQSCSPPANHANRILSRCTGEDDGGSTAGRIDPSEQSPTPRAMSPAPIHAALAGVVARAMQAAVAPFADECFITPMAAVAGAVADEILHVMCRTAPLARAYVNNGGDVALHLRSGESFMLGLVDRPDRPSLFARARIAAHDPARGIATSGWRGRSFSLGIADAVTILAATAAQADAAATVVANAVDLPGHPAIVRAPACSIKPDNDLGDIPVTRAVGLLAPHEIGEAVARGLARARDLRDRGLIHAAAIHLQGETRVLVPGEVEALRLPLAPSLTQAGPVLAHV